MMEWYSRLGVAQNASAEQIKSAFRRLSKEHHPDRRPGHEDLYRAIVEAYEEGMRQHEEPARPVAGDTIRRRLDLTVRESARGGRFDLGDVVVVVPPGVRGGTTLRLSGRGGVGRHGGPPGDLLVDVTVLREPGWRRAGSDLIHTLRVTWLAAYRGDIVRLETPWGGRYLHLSPGSTSESAYVVPGLGAEPGGKLRIELELVPPLPGQVEVEAALRDAVFPRTD